MKRTCSVWAAGLWFVSVLSAACPPMRENSCSRQPLLPLTRTRDSQQGQFVCLCAGSQRRRWPSRRASGTTSLFHFREVNAREKWSYTLGVTQSQAEPCAARSKFCNNLLRFLSTFSWMAFSPKLLDLSHEYHTQLPLRILKTQKCANRWHTGWLWNEMYSCFKSQWK